MPFAKSKPVFKPMDTTGWTQEEIDRGYSDAMIKGFGFAPTQLAYIPPEKALLHALNQIDASDRARETAAQKTGIKPSKRRMAVLARLNSIVAAGTPMPLTSAALKDLDAEKKLSDGTLARCFFELRRHKFSGTDAALILRTQQSYFAGMSGIKTQEAEDNYIARVETRGRRGGPKSQAEIQQQATCHL